MEQIIRIDTDNQISVHPFPSGDYSTQNKVIRELIGPDCTCYEHVMPKRLYSQLGSGRTPENRNCASMLIDEDGMYHNLSWNMVGSYLYEFDKHGNMIFGTILIVGEKYGDDGIDFCGLTDKQFESLYPQLENLTKKARNLK
jgi:hypothetical protein